MILQVINSNDLCNKKMIEGSKQYAEKFNDSKLYSEE